MAKNNDAAAPVTPAEADSFDLTLDEFCARLSATDKRVEFIAAFHHVEEAAGRLRDTEDAYRARLAAFAARPVA